VTELAKKSVFYDFLARYAGTDFETYMAKSVPDEDYLNWNGYTLPYVFEDEEKEYNSVRGDVPCSMPPRRTSTGSPALTPGRCWTT
jgi:hypothetical protein